MDDRINIHHIGGRDGSFPFPINPAFKSDLVVHLYDGDDACLAQMETTKISEVETRAHFRLFAGKTGEVTLNIGYDPYWSSLLPTNPAYTGATRFAQPQDYSFGDVNAVARTFTGQATSIDDFVRESGERIDILSVDVEGADFDVLEGGVTALRDSIVAVYTEYSFFHRFQSGQKLFGDICSLMERAGFRLAWMQRGADMELSRRPIGFRGQGVPTGGDCLFLKIPEAIRSEHADPDLGLAKLAFAALSWGQLDLALSALNLVADIPRLRDRCRSYGRFLAGIQDAYRAAAKVYPALYSDLWSHERSSARFAPGYDGTLIMDYGRVRERVLPRYTAQEFLTGLIANSGPPLSAPFEQLLVEHGFEKIATEVSESRRLLIGGLVSTLGVMTPEGAMDMELLTALVGHYCRPAGS